MISATARAPVIPIFAQPTKPTPGKRGYKWSAAQRRKFKATALRKRRERKRLAQEEGRKGRRGGSPIASPRAAYAGKRTPAKPAEGRLDRPIASYTGRKARVAIEGRTDAIVFLRAATEGYEGTPTSVCYSLLALRRLLGQIK